MEWMILPLKRYADFEGRSRRKEYWMFALGTFLLVLLLEIPMFAMIGAARDGAEPSAFANIFGLLFAVFALALIVPSLAVQVRRFHDQDKSGWMILLGLIPFVGGIILLVFMCTEGTRGPNRYGPDPKDPEGGYGAGRWDTTETTREPLPRRPDLM